MGQIDTRLYDLEKKIPAIIRDQMTNILSAGRVIKERREAAVMFINEQNTEKRKYLLEYIDHCNEKIREVFGL